MSNLVVTLSAEIARPPPPGAPYSVSLEGSELPGRSQVYRHWRFKDALLETLDPEVRSPLIALTRVSLLPEDLHSD